MLLSGAGCSWHSLCAGLALVIVNAKGFSGTCSPLRMSLWPTFEGFLSSRQQLPSFVSGCVHVNVYTPRLRHQPDGISRAHARLAGGGWSAVRSAAPRSGVCAFPVGDSVERELVVWSICGRGERPAYRRVSDALVVFLPVHTLQVLLSTIRKSLAGVCVLKTCGPALWWVGVLFCVCSCFSWFWKGLTTVLGRPLVPSSPVPYLAPELLSLVNRGSASKAGMRAP